MPNHEEYLWYKEHRICPVCGHAMAAPGKVCCDSCLEKHRVRDHERYKKVDRNKENTYQRQRRKKLKDAGICFRCGKKDAEPGKTMCIECQIKYRRWNNAWHKRNSRQYKENGLCRWCNNKAIPGKEYCAEHYTDLVNRATHMREFQKTSKFRDMNNAFWKEMKREV